MIVFYPYSLHNVFFNHNSKDINNDECNVWSAKICIAMFNLDNSFDYVTVRSFMTMLSFVCYIFNTPNRYLIT